MNNNLNDKYENLRNIFLEYCNSNDLVGDLNNSKIENLKNCDLNGLIDDFQNTKNVFLKYVNLNDLVGDFNNLTTQYSNLNDLICDFKNLNNVFNEYSNLNDLIGDFEISKNIFIEMKKLVNGESCKSTIQIKNKKTSEISNMLEYDIEDYDETIKILKFMHESDQLFEMCKNNYSNKVVTNNSSSTECFFMHYFNNNSRSVSFSATNIHKNLLNHDYSDVVVQLFKNNEKILNA